MTVLAAAAASTSADTETGVLAFLIIAALALICVFLFRSMNKQFRKIGPPPDKADSVD